ncbi:hypothetical protein N8J89_13310 [Crossiella sp. CA-258035]|uniref:hypothetical protein n=1 Tax=Crossiella sp. CA-258035 TaxID=2981138 RepID=UPI0024BD0D2E|nr:hypothetical protein [Crossiella sp. CA-258035]WHT21996.1 hypothetical protein N8J89_13310 [Crossiella sp. CA-258035]
MKAALGVLVVLALAAAGWFGWGWWSASGDPGLRQAVERDSALAAGQAAVVELNTLDHRDVEAGLARWRAVATGTLLEELSQSKEQHARDIRTARTATTAKLLSAALTTVDGRAGAATLIAAVEVTVAREGAQASTQRSRLSAELVRTAQGWRVGRLQTMGVGGP